MRAAIYARYSTEQQSEASNVDQIRQCERIAASERLEIVARFQDAAISGGTTERPGYQAMLGAARAGDFKILIAEDISRLWRNRAEYGVRSAELEDIGVHYLSCTGDDTRRDGWGMMLAIKQAMAEQYRRDISYRTRRGLEGRALAGKSCGTRCYGYNPTTWTINEAEAAVVRRIFESPLSQAAMAAELNYEGVPAPRGPHWSQSTVGAIRSNPRYTGAVIWGASAYPRLASDSAHRRRIRRPSALVARHDESRRIVTEVSLQAA
jgi:site-specific DNA recombinase